MLRDKLALPVRLTRHVCVGVVEHAQLPFDDGAACLDEHGCSGSVETNEIKALSRVHCGTSVLECVRCLLISCVAVAPRDIRGYEPLTLMEELPQRAVVSSTSCGALCRLVVLRPYVHRGWESKHIDAQRGGTHQLWQK